MFREEMRRRGFVFLSGVVGVMRKLHRHREVEVNLALEGEIVYLFGGKRVTLPPGQVAVFWATIPHGVVQVAPGTRYYCVHLPLTRFLRWQIAGGLTSRLLHGEIVREVDASLAERDLLTFERWRQDLELEGEAPDVNQVILLELEARLRRLAWGANGDAARHEAPAAPATDTVATLTQAPRREPSPDRVEQMAVFITEHYPERIAMAEIADAVGLHPKYAATLFRNHCGMTPGEYLTQQRLSQAQRLLVTTDGNIVDIAFAAGFGSVSQFYDVFTRCCGQSPGEYRAAQL